MMNLALEHEQLRQRVDFTYKFNTKTGRHGWLRLTPAYSLKIVEDLIIAHGSAKRIFDPFCGTATTALSAAYHGREGVTTDINPFLVWFGRAKTATYTSAEIMSTSAASALALDLVKRQGVAPVDLPSIHNIERWWNPKELDFLRNLKSAIMKVTKEGSAERTRV